MKSTPVCQVFPTRRKTRLTIPVLTCGVVALLGWIALAALT
ncbi:MAG TPA: hypothetical protein VEC06_08970 [Paucimonas sp.]|nr:hypothetical protein [Paucimonas sp.]